MKTLLVLCPNATDTTSYYRGMGPLSHLKRNFRIAGEDLDLTFTNNVTWASVSPCDAVFFQRPFKADHLKMLRVAQANFKPIWLDFDDDLFNVQRDNPTYKVYGRDDVKAQVAEMVAMADLVTVSTDKLKEAYSPLNQNVVVVPNAIDENFIRVRPDRRGARTGCVFWRGSETHVRDVQSVSPEILRVFNSREADGWVIHFQGMDPWWISEQLGKKCTHGRAIDFFEYMRMLHELQPEIMIVPLAQNDFNLAKSNIAYLEGCFAGAAVIAPDIPEFRRPGVLNYTSERHFGEILENAMLGKYDLTEISEGGWHHIAQNETLAVRNVLRQKALEALFTKQFADRKVKLVNWMSHKTF